MRRRPLGLITLVLVCVGSASAQQSITLRFHDDGRVTLSARNAPIPAILSEWARVGGATIVNAERVIGSPVTLELSAVPERQALEVVLRDVAGYMLAPRRAGTAGPSMVDRIVILPTSVGPRTQPPAPAAAAGRPVVPRAVVPQTVARPPEAVTVVEPPADDGLPDTAEVAAGGQMDQVPANGQMPLIVPSPTTASTAPIAPPSPSNPFGIPRGASARPGVIAPAPPQPPPPRQGPTPIPRQPGGAQPQDGTRPPDSSGQ